MKLYYDSTRPSLKFTVLALVQPQGALIHSLWE